MTQVFTEDGVLIPVTVVEATPNVVLQKKTVENDGYEAVQLGFEDVKEKRSTKPEIGHAAKANTAPKRFVEEVRDCELEVNVGDEVKSKLISSLLEKQLMLSEQAKVKDSWVQSFVTMRKSDLRVTVLDITDTSVLWQLTVLHLVRGKS